MKDIVVIDEIISALHLTWRIIAAAAASFVQFPRARHNLLLPIQGPMAISYLRNTFIWFAITACQLYTT